MPEKVLRCYPYLHPEENPKLKRRITEKILFNREKNPERASACAPINADAGE